MGGRNFGKGGSRSLACAGFFALLLVLLTAALLPTATAGAGAGKGETGNRIASTGDDHSGDDDSGDDSGNDTRLDFAAPGQAYNVLPPGQQGTLFPFGNSIDQLPLYDGLTSKFDTVGAADLPTFFKPNVLGLAGEAPKSVIEPPERPGLKIERDVWAVPHITASTRADVMFGAGYTQMQDRSFLMENFRGPGRIAALDVPGIDAFTLAAQIRPFTPTAQTEAFLQQQVALLEQTTQGRQVLADIRNYVEGMNVYLHTVGLAVPDWTENDVLAVAALLGGVFGKGGGDEVRRSELLSALQARLGAAQGTALWNDLRRLHDPETSTSLDRRFTYGTKPHKSKGNAIVDNGSIEPFVPGVSAASEPQPRMSNALLIGAKRSATGHPLMVAGPQVGYFYPQVLMEMDLHGGGIDARGAVFPGSSPYVELGRGRDFAWSATSAGSDIIDQYVEVLCGDDKHYVFRGECREMTTFDAGLLGAGGGQPQRQITFRETVHGPVTGYATVGGKRVALSQKRSTRGREALSAIGFAALNDNTVDSPKSFFQAASDIDFTFNWFYADHEDIAMYSSGRLPLRHDRVDPGLPTLGTGRYEWRGFLQDSRHPHGVNPKSGAIVNWNNKPAPGFAASDENWAYGPVQRNDLLEDAIAVRDSHELASLVAAMNRAATQDLRVWRVLPSIRAVLEGSSAPTLRSERALAILGDWRAAGGSRLDLDLDGKIDHPGAAIMDAAWNRLADAVMSPVLGPQLDQLARVAARDQNAGPNGSSYQAAWYGYLDKDLRTLAGLPVKGRFSNRFCGQGDLAACRTALWSALDAAAAQLEAAQGTDPSAWRADATRERIRFQPGLLRTTMRWTNRPTFQQVISFDGHR